MREKNKDIRDLFKEAGNQKDGNVAKCGSRYSMNIRTATCHFELDDSKIEQLRKLAVQSQMEIAVLANTWDLPDQEINCLRDCFEFSDADGSGQVNGEELKTVLKSLGCTPMTASQKKAFAKIVEKREFVGDLEFPALVKFLVQYYEACAEEVLTSMQKEGEESGGVPVDMLVRAFYQVGQYMNKTQAMTMLESVGGDTESKVVNKQTFCKMVGLDRGEKAQAWRQKCGYSENQCKAIKHAFTSQCNEGENTMERDGHVLEALKLLNLSPAPEKLEGLLCALIRLDRAGEGRMTFEDFLMLVRHLDNQKNFARSQEEQQVARTAGIDADSALMLRQVFNDYDPNVSGKIGVYRLCKLLLDTGTVKNTRNRNKMQEIIADVAGEDKDGVSFSQFLEVLRRLEKEGIS